MSEPVCDKCGAYIRFAGANAEAEIDNLKAENERLREEQRTAYYLAQGSAGTCWDLERLYRTKDERIADEFQHLKLNFQRIEEILSDEEARDDTK